MVVWKASVLVLAGTELTLFIVSGMIIHFGLRRKAMLIATDILVVAE